MTQRLFQGASRRSLSLLILLGSTVLPSLASAAPGSPAFAKPVEPVIRAAAPGEPALAPDVSSPAEKVALDKGVVPLLLSLPPEAEARIADWPVAPEVRADVVLTRHEVYAPDARIFKVGRNGKLIEVPRSNLVFYWGSAEVDGDTRVFVSVDPATGRLEGFSQSFEGIQELRPQTPQTTGDDSEGGQYLVAPAEAFMKASVAEGDMGESSWSCGEETLPRDLVPNLAERSSLSSIFDKAITSLHTATIAVDTDNELMSGQFANNTTNATNYIASLIAKMNVIYERDLLIRLVQGHTILRTSNVADPYPSAVGGNADGTKLNEFTNYWRNNYGNVTRALAMMLSGKQGGGGASGIAWVGALCSTYSGYSFNQVYGDATFDAGLVGHEIGHNFGSPHTHCYNPPVDTCFSNGGTGCYVGGTSCPAATTINGVTNVRGTIMSYCHHIGGCGKSNVFHPATVAMLQPRIQNAVNSCIIPLVTGPTVTGVSPASGSTAGGTTVTLTGSNFLPGASVTIGGVPATSVTVVNANTLRAVTGAHAAGTVSVQVTSGVQSTSLSNAFFYSPPPATSSFYTLAPCRVLDTRNANGPLGGPGLAPSAVRTFDLTGPCGIPNTAKAVSVNVTVVNPTAPGFLSIFPGNAIPLGTSSLSFTAGRVRANGAVLRLATDGAGTIGVQNGAGGITHLIIDVNGYFQ